MKHLRIICGALLLALFAAVAVHAPARAAVDGAVCSTSDTGGTACTFTQLKPNLNEEVNNLNTRAVLALTSVTGTNTITACTTPALTAYVDRQPLSLKPAADNTGAVTLNVCSIAAKSLVDSAGNALTSGNLKSTTIYNVVYFAANDQFRVISPLSGSSVGLTSGDIDTSAELDAIVTDDTGSGALVFANSPTLVTPTLGTPASGTMTNVTGLPIATGVSGLGTGVATALATPSSANVAAALTDETGTGAAVFGTTPTFTTSVIAMGDTIDDFTGFGMALSSGDLGLLTTGALDGECLAYESTGPTIDWITCGGGGVSDGDKGDITVSGSGATWSVDSGAVTATEIASTASGNIAATNAEAAIDELDSEKAGLALANSFTAANTFNTNSTPLTATTTSASGVALSLINSHSTGEPARIRLQNSASGLTAGDILGELNFYQSFNYGNFKLQMTDVTGGSEDSAYYFLLSSAGTLGTAEALKLSGTGAGFFGLTDAVAGINSPDYFDNGTNINTLYQGIDGDLTCYAGLTSAADKIAYYTGAGTCATADFSSAIRTLITTPSSANLRAMLSDELGTGPLFFLGAPASDDQAFVSSSTTAGAWGTIPDSDGATQKLQYDQATNAFIAGTDDDVPEVSDFAALVGGVGVDNNSGTLDFDGTELTTSLTLGAGAFTTLTFDAGAVDIAAALSSGQLLFNGGGTAPIIGLDDQGILRLLEEDANGSNFIAFQPPAAITSDVTIALENDANPIPDSAVGDGVDDDAPEIGDFGALAGGSGIDNNSGTLDFDGTEINSATWGAGSFTGFTFDAGAVDIAMALSSGEMQFNAGGTSPIIGLDDAAELRFYEEDAGGTNYVRLIGPATLAANVDCQFDSSGRLPDSCVGDGVDAGAGGGSGDVVGPGSATDNAIPRYDGTTGKIIQNSGVTITDANTLVVAPGSSTDPSVLLQSGTLMTTASDGSVQMDGNAIYAATDAGNRGYIPVRNIIRQDSTRTLTSNVAEQALFDESANGRLTLETGTYLMECQLSMGAMSATSGNAAFDIIGSGSAVLDQIAYSVTGNDAAAGATGSAVGGSHHTAAQTGASMVTAATGTALGANINGSFRVSTAGTIVPSVTMVTASASTVLAGTYCAFERFGGTTGATPIGQFD